MKTVVGFPALVAGVFVAFLLQMSLPPVHVLHGARLVFVPMVFCYAAMVLPFPAMLAGAVYVGLLSDLMFLNVAGGQVEIALGWSIVFFVIYGCLAHGLQPGMRRGIWWPYIPLSALVTSSYLLLQFVMITFRRQGLFFNEDGVWRILAPGMLAAMFAPLVHLGVDFLAQFIPTGARRIRDYPG